MPAESCSLQNTVSLPFASSGHIITPGVKAEARQQPPARGLPDSLTSFLLLPVPGSLGLCLGPYEPPEGITILTSERPSCVYTRQSHPAA